jgi:hypothetical protein
MVIRHFSASRKGGAAAGWKKKLGYSLAKWASWPYYATETNCPRSGMMDQGTAKEEVFKVMAGRWQGCRSIPFPPLKRWSAPWVDEVWRGAGAFPLPARGCADALPLNPAGKPVRASCV